MKTNRLIAFFALGIFLAGGSAAFGANKQVESVLARWTKSESYKERDTQGYLGVKVTLYSAEYVEALIEAEAEKNLWTVPTKRSSTSTRPEDAESEEYVPFHISFENYGPSMHMAPFDKMVWL